MCFTATAVANTILDMAAKRNINDITPMKLQKLVFLAHAMYYRLNNKTPLISDQIGVWQYGPVIQDIYSEFRGFGANPITRYAQDALGMVDIVPKNRKDIYDHLENILDLFGNVSAWRLSELTHLPDTAWSLANNRNSGYISNEDIERGKIYRA